MSTAKPDIIELFGLPARDPQVAARIQAQICPFTGRQCSKTLRGSGPATGVCALSQGATKQPVIVCANRLHGDNHATLRMAAIEGFGVDEFIIGGTRDELEERMLDHKGPASVAFGQDSGHPVQVRGRTSLAFDWIVQNYTARRRRTGFIAVETPTLEVTGSYRACLDGYRDLHAGGAAAVPASEHVVNWGNVHKKMLPDLIQKGLIVANTVDCRGFFVIMPDALYQKIEDVLEDVSEQDTIGPEIMSIRTYAPDAKTTAGVRAVRAMNFRTKEVAAAHYGRVDEAACKALEKTLRGLLA